MDNRHRPHEKLRPQAFHPLGKRGQLDVPTSMDAITPVWLTKALQVKEILPPGCRITKVKAQPVGGEGKGMMSEMALLDLTFERDAPTSVPRRLVAKLSPKSDSALPQWVVKQQFRQEAHFYNDFTVESGGLPRPECYVALEGRTLIGRPIFCMLLEYVAKATMCTRVRSCSDLERLHRVMAALATLHARWWEHPRAAPIEA